MRKYLCRANVANAAASRVGVGPRVGLKSEENGIWESGTFSDAYNHSFRVEPNNGSLEKNLYLVRNALQGLHTYLAQHTRTTGGIGDKSMDIGEDMVGN